MDQCGSCLSNSNERWEIDYNPAVVFSKPLTKSIISGFSVQVDLVTGGGLTIQGWNPS